MKDMLITIPSHNRESSKEQITIRKIPEDFHNNVFFFTDESRVNSLKKAIPSACSVVPVPSELGTKGIAGKRQFILEWSESVTPKIWQLDDSLVFCKNAGVHPSLKAGPQLLRTNDDDFREFYREVSVNLDFYPLVGCLNRSGTYQSRSNAVTDEDVRKNLINKRMYSCLAMRPKFFLEEDIRFDYLQRRYNDDTLSLMEDYALQLQLLTKGFKQLQIGNFCFDKNSGTGKGGCTDERDAKRQRNVAESLKNAFPDFVKVVKKSHKVGWESMPDRYDVMISWRKFSEGQEENKQDEQNKDANKKRRTLF